MKRILALAFGLLIYSEAQAQDDRITGIVVEEDEKGNLFPLIGANVYWLGTTKGTSTDTAGTFHLVYDKLPATIIISYIGYKNDTIEVRRHDRITVVLKSRAELKTVEVTFRTRTTQLKLLDPRNTQTMTRRELFKAACCNLSESFETNPSVDVSFTDAITGTKQIRMLGLAGPYSVITRENMPGVRGLASVYGMSYIPGTWLNSIQLSKGTGTVINGYESIAGQINTELKKPEDSEKFFVNLYTNEARRLEANVNGTFQLNDRWASTTLLHSSDNSSRIDRNNDGFLDKPVKRAYIGMHRWKYSNNKGHSFQAGIKGTAIDQLGGEVEYEPELHKGASTVYGMEMETRRLEGWVKNGFVFPEKLYRSIGLQLSAVSHQHNSYFGNRLYNADQQTFYANLIYQSIISNTLHKFKTGASFLYDNSNEYLGNRNFDINEQIPGAFFEYDHTLDNYGIIAGLRGDYHNLYGLMITPKIHG
ncbi:MAG: TonB-dependent receptor, partial [Bacteroidetes bacterium]|nr:TonB-dependent receptor [Bacteroidota bacterium]